MPTLKNSPMCPTKRQLKQLAELEELVRELERKLEVMNTISPAAAAGNITFYELLESGLDGLSVDPDNKVYIRGYPVFRLNVDTRGFIVGDVAEVRKLVSYVDMGVRLSA
jgi:hypothetical protein